MADPTSPPTVPRKILMTSGEFQAKVSLLASANGEKELLIQQLSTCFARQNTPAELKVVKDTEFIYHLAEVMKVNVNWARDVPTWIINAVDSIYYNLQWEIPQEQTKRLLDVAIVYLKEHESEFTLRLLHRIVTPVGNKKLVFAEMGAYGIFVLWFTHLTSCIVYNNSVTEPEILKNIVTQRGTLKFHAVRCLQAAVLNSAEWQKRIMLDTQFVKELLDDPKEECWALLSIVAQHFDAKLFLPAEVKQKAKLNQTNEHCINICAILCDEDGANDLELVRDYVEKRSERLNELLRIQHEVGNTFHNSLLSLVLPFVNMSIADSNKEILGAKLISPLLKVLRITTDQPLISKIANCLERSKQEASRALWNLAFNRKNMAHIEAEDGLQLLNKLATSSNDKKVARNANGILFLFSQREAVITKRDHPPQLTKGHVMISYNWANQSTIKRLADALKNEFTVWVDYEQMEGSTLATMAKAVEGASIMLMCFSQKYKDSPNCRLEGEYCLKRGIKFIPLRLQKAYKADGWLGIALGSQTYHDFSSEDDWNSKIGKLKKEMRNLESPPHLVRGCSRTALSSSGWVRPVVDNWSDQELLNWMECNQISAHYGVFIANNINVSSLLELKSLLESDGKVAVGLELLKTYFGLSKLGDLMNVSVAIRNFKLESKCN